MNGVEGAAAASSVNDHGGASSAAAETRQGVFGDRQVSVPAQAGSVPSTVAPHAEGGRQVSVALREALQRPLLQSREAGGIAGAVETHRPLGSRLATAAAHGPGDVARVERQGLRLRTGNLPSEPPSDFLEAYSVLVCLRAEYQGDFRRLAHSIYKRLTRQLKNFGGQAETQRVRLFGRAVTEQAYLALTDMSSAAFAGGAITRGNEIRTALAEVEKAMAENLRILWTKHGIGSAPSTTASLQALPHRPTEVEPPTAVSRTETAAANPGSVSRTETVAANPGSVSRTETAAANPGSVSRTETAAANPGPVSRTETVAANAAPTSARAELDWITAYRRLAELGDWFSKEGQAAAKEHFKLAEKRVREVVRPKFNKHSEEGYQLPPVSQTVSRPEQMYVALQEMARGASDRGDGNRADAIRLDIKKLDRHMTEQLAGLASVYGSIDGLAARAGLLQPGEPAPGTVPFEPGTGPAGVETKQSHPPRQRTRPEGAAGRQRGLVWRNVGQVDSRNRPYPAPEARARVNWFPLYDGINSRHAADVERGDIYAAAASAAALLRVGGAVMDAYRSFRASFATGEEATTPKAAMSKLRAMRGNAFRGSNSRLVAIRETLDDISRLTLETHSDLALRSSEFAVVSSPAGATVPGREVLEAWLLQQADAAGAPSIEHRYFRQLASRIAGETDPWSVSRGLLGSLSAGDAEQAERLQAAHRSLVLAMAGDFSQRLAPSVSGDAERPYRVMWTPIHETIKGWCEADAKGGDIYAAAASAAALHQIDRAVMDAYTSNRTERAKDAESLSPEKAVETLRTMQSQAKARNRTSRYELIESALGRVFRLTKEKYSELALRRSEFAAVSSPAPAAVPTREALGAWLLQQADAAGVSSIEYRYFRQLASRIAGNTDPWSVSRALVGGLSAGDAEQVERLQAAHRSLVQAMAGTLPASSPRPVSLATATPVPDGSQASASRQQPLLTRLLRGEQLSNDQRQAILAGVSQATAAGKFPESTSRPETWAADLLQRIQENTGKPWAALTDIEKAGVVDDWTRMRDLIQTLEAAGYL